jgi:hypothetical protein
MTTITMTTAARDKITSTARCGLTCTRRCGADAAGTITPTDGTNE